MMKRMLLFICLIACIGSNFAEDCTSDERCCVKSAAGGCAVCCPNKIDIGHILAIFKGIKDKLPELMNEMNGMKERDDPDWTKPVEETK